MTDASKAPPGAPPTASSMTVALIPFSDALEESVGAYETVSFKMTVAFVFEGNPLGVASALVRVTSFDVSLQQLSQSAHTRQHHFPCWGHCITFQKSVAPNMPAHV